MIRFDPAVMPLLIPIEDVQQYPGNPRNGDVDAIIASIEQVGFLVPVTVQRSTGYIVSGNHRYMALMELGSEVIPAIVADLTDEEAKRFLVSDNRTSDLATYDQGQLADLLSMLAETEVGLAGTGFSDYDLEVLLAENATPGEFERGMKGFTQTLMLAFPSDVYTDVCNRLDAHAHEMGTKDRARALADMLGVTDD